MADFKVKYRADAALTVTNLQSLASSSTRVAGWTSDGIVNTTNLDLDYLVGGEFKVNGSVAPTDGKSIEVYAYACYRDNGGSPVWPDIFSSGTEGTEGAATVHDEEQRDCGLVRLWSCRVDTGTGEVYSMPPRSIRQAFGVVPQRFALFVTHDTGQALNSSGNALYYVEVQEQSV